MVLGVLVFREDLFFLVFPSDPLFQVDLGGLVSPGIQLRLVVLEVLYLPFLLLGPVDHEDPSHLSNHLVH